MARVETQRPKIIILGVFLNILLATALSTNRFVSKRSSHDQLNHQSKTHNSTDNSTEAYNQTTRSLDSGLSRDTFHGLPPILSGPLVTTGLLTAPVTQASSISDSFGQGLSAFPGFGANMTISVPTTTLSILTATKSDSDYIPYPTSAPSSGSSQSYNSSEVIAQATVVVTVNPPESSPTPVETPPELSTSTQIVWATAPPTVSSPTSPSTGSNTNMSSNSNSIMISSNYLMFICSFTTVLSYIVLFR
ncbi:uncharacterized protein MELLADRAFT_61460 [Melampsora larici-populina 98AG31]|uniref:Uncharacterized protein n=1 Tax=Melampsora larici-populina (strain 98AG31 / pathotype 3-4-7) TaxID=747676 RepID=F4REZ6_MELLP|nr:uncharacterized protein MELLADRAFT_61460 [Melampsora larici-populina 98AG31]EGG09202.1 hypothetical protein MELLADRAFT_61460 [Melampsora larici-populina 98AG31]